MRPARFFCRRKNEGMLEEFDIKGLFDNIAHALLLKAVRKHVTCPWAVLYIERWLTAPMVMEDGTQVERTCGTPQGGVVRRLRAQPDKKIVDSQAAIPSS